MSPPTSTTSRVRERRLHAGPMIAPQLRSDAHPRGLPHLQGDQKAAVTEANRLLDFLAEVFLCRDAAGLPVICENPHRSLLWRMQPWHQLHHISAVRADLCEYGDPRERRVTIVSRHVDCHPLRASCSGLHTHQPWAKGKLHNAFSRDPVETAKYPDQFCQRLVSMFVPTNLVGNDAACAVDVPRLPPDRQHRRHPFELMSEYATILRTVSPKPWQAGLVAKGDAFGLTHDIRVIGCCGLGSGAAASKECLEHEVEIASKQCLEYEVEIGVLRTPKEWHEEASKALSCCTLMM
eukprot:477039-Amphidinium_carterae.1